MGNSKRVALFVLYPISALLNSFGMTVAFLLFGLFGFSELAADVALIQAATLAIFYAFSANARNLILADSSYVTASHLLKTRLLLLFPLSISAWALSVVVGGVGETLAIIMILRRVAEWFAEIGLAVHERSSEHRLALQGVIVEGITLILFITLPLFANIDVVIAAIPWMLSPMLSFRNVLRRLELSERLMVQNLLPHFGSTAIIGISVYVFRLSIALLVGKPYAGELFTTFAIGGIIPTVFGQAFAPSFVRGFGVKKFWKSFLIFPVLMLLIGVGTAGSSLLMGESITILGRSINFWFPIGCSISGGAIMLIAIALRTQLIQFDDGHEVFGPDLLANALISISVPFVFYMFGIKAMGGLYLLSSCLSLIFLLGAGKEGGVSERWRPGVLSSIAALLVFPVFFQIKGGLFSDPSVVFDSNGVLNKLPIPVSAIVLFLGIAVIGNYKKASRMLLVVFSSAILFVVTSLIVTKSAPQNEGGKLILLAQFLLPMFGLILGEMYGSLSSLPTFERVSYWVLILVLPLQLVATWVGGHIMLLPKIFFFSIYQHLQYFPMIVAALTIAISVGLTNYPDGILKAKFLLPISLVYLAASLSISAILAGVIGLAVFTANNLRVGPKRKESLQIFFISLFCCLIYLVLVYTGLLSKLVQPGVGYIDEMTWHEKFTSGNNSNSGYIPVGVAARESIWLFYIRGLGDSLGSFVWGHLTPPDRNIYPSAHNYWIDGLYNFGLLSMLPLIFLVGFTMRLIMKCGRKIFSDSTLLGCILALAYLLFGENFIKVGMRQPYPGIVTFFIWGLLVARLSKSLLVGESNKGMQ